jgi:hypothetical protein
MHPWQKPENAEWYMHHGISTVAPRTGTILRNLVGALKIFSFRLRKCQLRKDQISRVNPHACLVGFSFVQTPMPTDSMRARVS